jgi:hypothetical protein
MRDYRDAKAMARTLRQALKAQAITISHSNAIELIAKALGFRNWQVLEARIAADNGAAKASEPSADSKPSVRSCSFCGKTQFEVSKLIAGPAVFICDECVGLCEDVIVHMGGHDPANYIEAQGGLATKSPEALASLRAKAGKRIAYARRMLEVVEGGDGPPDRAAYAAAVRERLSGLEQVSAIVEGLLGGAGSPAAG